jgi:hypothetical protein
MFRLTTLRQRRLLLPDAVLHVPARPMQHNSIDVDHVAEPLVLVLSGVDGLGNVPVSGCVVEVLVDVVVHATGHVLEEFRHASGPATSRTPLPRSIVEHLAVAHEADQRTDRTHFPGVQDAISPCASVHNDRTSQRRHVPSCMY